MKEKLQNKAESANRDFRSNVRAGDNILEFSIEMLFRTRRMDRNVNANKGKQETQGEPRDTLIFRGCEKTIQRSLRRDRESWKEGQDDVRSEKTSKADA